MVGGGNRDIIVSFSHFVVSIVITFRRFHPQPFWLKVVLENSTLRIQSVLSFGMFEYERREIQNGALLFNKSATIYGTDMVLCAQFGVDTIGNAECCRCGAVQKMLTALPESRGT